MLDTRIRRLEQKLKKEDCKNMRIVIAFQQEDGTVLERSTGETWESLDACKAALGEDAHILSLCVDSCMGANVAQAPQGMKI